MSIYLFKHLIFGHLFHLYFDQLYFANLWLYKDDIDNNTYRYVILKFGQFTSVVVAQMVDKVDKKVFSERAIQEIIRRIVEVAQPEKIILFGSAARGEIGPNSDVDLLVIKSGAHRRKLMGDIYMRLFGVGQAVDVIVVTPEDVERYGKCPALIIEPALREGRVVYVA